MGFGFKYFLLIFLCSVQLWADSTPSFLKTLRTQYFYYDGKQRFGLEVEYTHLSIEEAAGIAKSFLGGTIEASKSKEGLDALTVKSSLIGDIKIKVETNQTGESINDKSNWVYEIVSDPLTYPQVFLFQVLLNKLKYAGARGAENGAPLSTQTNTEAQFKTEAPILSDEDIKFEFLVTRNHYNNYKQILKELAPNDSRLEYIQPASDRMMIQFSDSSYDPTALDILHDYIYRQSMELFIKDQAWKLPIAEVKRIAKELRYPIVKRVVKLNSYRISSMLLYRFPSDPYLQQYLKHTWTFRAPISEQRARNNDFNVIDPVQDIVALRNATRLLGLFLYNPNTGELEPLRKKTAVRAAPFLALKTPALCAPLFAH